MVPLLILAPAGSLAVYVWDAGRSGLSGGTAAAALLALVVTHVAPGTVIWRAIRTGPGSWFEDVTVGLSLGVVLAIAAQVLVSSLGLPWAAPLPAGLTVGALLAMPATRRRVVGAPTRRLPWWWGPSVAAPALLLLPQARAMYHAVPLDYAGFMSPYVDMPFHLSLAAQLSARGPSSFPYVSGEPLAYHWFSHAWMAQLAGTAGVELDTVVYRFLPAVSTVALVSVIAACAVRLARRPLAGPIAATIAVTTGLVSLGRMPVHAGMLKHLSPSLAVSSILLTGLVVVLADGWRGEGGVGHRILVALLAVGVGGTKGSAIAVVIGGLVLASIVAWLRGWPSRRPVTQDLATVVAAFLVTMAVVFRGAAQELALAPLASIPERAPVRFLFDDLPGASPVLIAVALGLIILATLAVGAGLVAALVLPGVRTDPAAWLLIGTGASGAVAFGLLDHPGGSHFYFLANAMPALAVGSGWGLSRLLGVATDGARRTILVATGAALLWWLLMSRLVTQPWSTSSTLRHAIVGAGALVVVIAVASLGSRGDRARGVAATVGLTVCLFSTVPVAMSLSQFEPPAPADVVPPGHRNAFAGDQIEAARWLRDHSALDDLVATNRHCANPRAQKCDNRRFFVAAYTERQVLVEGWGYTPTAVERSVELGEEHAYVPFSRPETLELNDRFLTSPSPEEALRLWNLGVRWLYIDEVVAHAGEFGDLATKRFATENATVYQLQAPDVEYAR